MRIRTQLVLACFVLAVLPLTGIVLYSYYSSRRALEMAYREEAQRLTRVMDRRLASTRAELDERLASLSSIPIPASTDEGNREAVVDSILMAMGEAAPLVDAVEFVPTHAEAQPHVVQIASATLMAPIVGERVVIDLPRVVVPRFEMSPEWHRSMGEVARLSAELGAKAATMSRQERDAKKKTIKQRSEVLERELEASRTRFQRQMEQARRQTERRRKRIERRDVAAAPEPPPPPPALPPDERQPSDATLLFGRRLNVPVEKEGEVVGQIHAQLRTEEVIRRILGAPTDDRSEIPFAIDREGNVYTRNAEDRRRLDALGVPQLVKSGGSLRDLENWVVALTRDEESGLRVGVARPVGQNLIELKQGAARNFGFGLGLIAFALIGMVPLANHFTRDVTRVTQGAERIAQGDLQTRLPVRGRDEFGQLALAFNRMAEDLSDHQRRLVEEERARREQEVQQRVLAMEYERKSVELEDARRFQLSMLPKSVPQHADYDLAVLTQTATEVGGDYYDFHLAPEGVLSVTIGDATGHGAKAGTMVTVIKTLFAGYGGDTSPSKFLGDAAEKIKRMELGRMAMALSLARFDRRRVTIASAGMPPLLVHRRAGGQVEEIALPATPLGTIGIEYAQRSVDLQPGDTVLLMSDGLPELLNPDGQQFGYAQAMQQFGAAASRAATASDVIATLSQVAKDWHGEQPPNDDVTFVVVRVR